jgi:hypothetical protein
MTSAQAGYTQPIRHRRTARTFGTQPEFCIYNCDQCRALPTYRRLADFDIPGLINQKKINDELALHGHKKSRIKKNGKARLTHEAKAELIDHYRYMHADELI